MKKKKKKRRVKILPVLKVNANRVEELMDSIFALARDHDDYSIGELLAATHYVSRGCAMEFKKHYSGLDCSDMRHQYKDVK